MGTHVSTFLLPPPPMFGSKSCSPIVCLFLPKSLKLFLMLLVATTKTEEPEGSNRAEEGGGMIMGGSGIGGVQWFLASPSTKDSSGCGSEASPRVETTVKGERPGAGLREEGPANLCIKRGEFWVFRPGQVEVRWVPDNSGMKVGEKMGRKTKEEVEVGSKQSTDKQSMDQLDEVAKKTLEKVEAKAKELELDREDL